MQYLSQFFSWMPVSIRTLCIILLVVFLVWVFSGLIKRILEIIPFA